MSVLPGTKKSRRRVVKVTGQAGFQWALDPRCLDGRASRRQWDWLTWANGIKLLWGQGRWIPGCHDPWVRMGPSPWMRHGRSIELVPWKLGDLVPRCSVRLGTVLARRSAHLGPARRSQRQRAGMRRAGIGRRGGRRPTGEAGQGRGGKLGRGIDMGDSRHG